MKKPNKEQVEALTDLLAAAGEWLATAILAGQPGGAGAVKEGDRENIRKASKKLVAETVKVSVLMDD